MTAYLPPSARSHRRKNVVVLWAFLFCSVITSLVLFAFTKELLHQDLRQGLIAIATTAASQVDAKDTDAVRTERDVNSKAYQRLVGNLRRVLEANPRLRYAYLMRAGEDPAHPTFIADADAALPGEAPRDPRAGLPGTPYDASGIPALQAGFSGLSADEALEEDPWGLTLSGYAPVRRSDGSAAALLGVDLAADDFYAHVRRAFIPTFVFIIFQLGLLLFLLQWIHWCTKRIASLEQKAHQAGGSPH